MFAKILVDIIIAAILVAGIVIGIKRGFILAAAKLLKWCPALIIAFLLSGTVATSIVEPLIDDPLTNQISDYLVDKCDVLTSDNVEDELPTVLKLAARIVDVDIDSFEGESGEALIAQIVDKLADPVIHLFAVIISFLLLYFLSKILLSILIHILNNIFEHGVLGVCNRVLGCVFCSFISIIVAWLFVLLFSYVINVPFIADAAWARDFDGGFLYDFFKRMSPLDILLSF